MSHCKQCIHFRQCQKTFLRAKANGQYIDTTEEEYFGDTDGCDFFADSELYLALPCKRGKKLYKVTYPYRKEPKVTEFIVVGFSTAGKKRRDVYVQVRVNGVPGVNTMKLKGFYSDRAEAEKELQEVLSSGAY